MVTSSAVVGSSAMMRSGSHMSAIAIITRCRSPPESWCGYCRSRPSAPVIPTFSSSHTARSRAAAALVRRWRRSASTSWSPTV